MNQENRKRRFRAPIVLLSALFLLGAAAALRATVVPEPHLTLNGIAGFDAHGIVAAWTSNHNSNHFTADITWGDGTSNSAGAVSSNGQKSFEAQGTHVYDAPDTYYGSVHVVDTDDDASADISFTAVIRETGLVPMALSIDDATNAGTDTDMDGVFEFGETVVMNPSWSSSMENLSAVTGFISNFHRIGQTAGETYSLDAPGNKETADYGSIAKFDTHDCYNGNDKPPCYTLSASLTGERPAAHMDALVSEMLPGGAAQQWVLHMGGSFADVGVNSLFYKDIETIFHNGVTVGCNPADQFQFCPNNYATRAQMAAFVSHAFNVSWAEHGGSPDAAVPAEGFVGDAHYNCTVGGNSLFTDIGPDNIFCKHVHYMASRGITLGCGGTQFCPWNDVTRGETAVFVARSQPPANPGGNGDVPMAYTDSGTGRSYDCNEATASLPFTDVSATDQFCRFIGFVWAHGIIDGYPDGTYRPGQAITRQEMSKLLTRGYDLGLYRP